jgi:hypothetical protein
MEGKEKSQVNLTGLSGDYKGLDYFISGDEFVIGRLPECDLVINETTISAKHAKIMRVQDHWELMDLKSTNGTSVNGKRVDRRILRTEDRISFDQHEFLFVNRRDVSRTEVVTGPAFEKMRSTEVRVKEAAASAEPPAEPRPAAPAIPQAQPAPQPPQPAPQPPPAPPVQPISRSPVVERGTSAPGSQGHLFRGGLMGFILAFVVITGGAFLVALASTPRLASAKVFGLLKVVIAGLALQHMASFWFTLATFSAPAIIILLLIIASLPASGFIVQRHSGGNRLAGALAFTAIYFSVWNLLILVIAEFNFRRWLALFARNGVGISDLTLSWLTGEVIFFLTVLLFSFLGTLMVRPGR